MKNRESDQWYPFFIDKYIFGSTRLELSPDERSVWIDLLTLSKKDNGFVRANEGVPYLKTQLCGLLVIPEELFDRTLAKCIDKKKIEQLPDGTLYVKSTEKYKLSRTTVWRHEQKVEHPDSTPKQGCSTMKPECCDPPPDVFHKGEERRIEDNKGKGDIAEVDVGLVQLLISLMQKNNPESSIIKRLTESRQREWLNQCRLMREADKRTPTQIECVIMFSQRDSFWKGNILSMPKLREKWDQLWMKMRRDTGADKSDGIDEWAEDVRKKAKDAGSGR
jgi:hypothetical protein